MQTSQHGVYEKAQGVQNYAAFAPPATAQHGGTSGSAFGAQDRQIPGQPASYEPALDVANYAAFAPPNSGGLEKSPL